MDKKLNIQKTKIQGLLIIRTNTWQDERGLFSRLYCHKELTELGIEKSIVQINHSVTHKKGTIRGLHMQLPPKREVKLIYCSRGAVFDVAVDLRPGSDTYLSWLGTELSPESGKLLLIPEGLAHGFQTLEDNSEMFYMHTEHYSPKHEKGINYFDSALKIKWPLKISHISKKDKNLPSLNTSK